jgi:aminoglycoside phosphotransferase (APT) family kinase protein
LVLLETMTLPMADSNGPLDLELLAARCSGAASRAGLGAVTDVRPMAVEGASLTYGARLQADGLPEAIVVKVAPPGLAPVRNRDVLRQARGIRAASAIEGVLVPTILFEDSGDPPEIPPLFGMTFVPGDCVELVFEGPPLPSPEEVRGRALSAAAILGALHRPDPTDLGLNDSPVTLREEVDRWVRAFSTVDESMTLGVAEAAELLVSDIPDARRPSLVHGDFRLGNMLCSGSSVTAVIDWELWAVSDGRLDLAWFLLHRDHLQNPHASREAPGMPTAGELVEAYEVASGWPVGELTWFEAVVRFKQAAAGALIWKRSMASPDDPLAIERRRKIRDEVADAIALLRGRPLGEAV